MLQYCMDNTRTFILYQYWPILQSCTKLLGHFEINTLFPASQNQYVVKDSALRMNKRHVYTNTAWWGREGRMHMMFWTWILNHTCHFVHIHLDYGRIVMISRACVPTNFVQDCRILPTMKVLNIAVLSSSQQNWNTDMFQYCLALMFLYLDLKFAFSETFDQKKNVKFEWCVLKWTYSEVFNCFKRNHKLKCVDFVTI